MNWFWNFYDDCYLLLLLFDIIPFELLLLFDIILFELLLLLIILLLMILLVLLLIVLILLLDSNNDECYYAREVIIDFNLIV
jgi:hypothetical protein